MNSNFSKLILLLRRTIMLAFVNPRGLREVLGTALAQSNAVIDPEADVTALPLDPIQNLATEVVTTTVRAFPPVDASISITEACSLAILLQRTKAKRVFEFGTYRGVSTTQIALNVPDDAQIITLDLPADAPVTRFEVNEDVEKNLVKLREKGEMIPPELRRKIKFLAQDSALFDPAPYANTMDLVFVDGAHTAEYVRNDSEKGWAMLRSGGIIVWHDCRPESPAVVKFLRTCAYQPRRISVTSFAFAVKP